MKQDRSQKTLGPNSSSKSLLEFEKRLSRFNTSIRSPLHTALGTAELLKDTHLDAGQLALVNAFIQATESVLAELQALFDNPAGSYLPPSRGSDATAESADPSASTILVVDDNRVNLTLTKEALEREGFKVRTAVDGREALDVFLTRQVSLVLMDLEMPIMDGWQACKAMRIEEQTNRNGNEKVPMVALTADSMDGAVERALQHGFDGYLSKPISRAQLLSSVRQMLAK